MTEPGTVEWLNETYAKQIAEIKAPFESRIADLEAKLATAQQDAEDNYTQGIMRGRNETIQECQAWLDKNHHNQAAWLLEMLKAKR